MHTLTWALNLDVWDSVVVFMMTLWFGLGLWPRNREQSEDRSQAPPKL